MDFRSVLVYFNFEFYTKYKKLFDIELYLMSGYSEGFPRVVKFPETCKIRVSSEYIMFTNEIGVSHIYPTENILLRIPEPVLEMFSELKKIDFNIAL